MRNKEQRPTIEVLENEWSNACYEVQLFCAEFTCLCPFTLKPDFAELTITYIPNDYLVETRSFKRYLAAFGNSPMLQEFAINTICSDIVAVLQPKKLVVKGDFAARGGIRITPTAQYSADCV